MDTGVLLLGIPTFMLNLGLAGLIKFHEMRQLGITIGVIMAIAFLIFMRSCLLWAPHLLTRGSDIFRVHSLSLVTEVSLSSDQVM